MTSHHLPLFLAGLFSTGVIAAATAMAQRTDAPWPVLAAMLLATYALGLAAGRLLWKRGA